MSTLAVATIKSVSSAAPVFQNTSGTEKGQLIKAWLNYDQINDNLRGSFNISTINDEGAGDFTVNFAASFSATDDYIPVGFVHRTNSAGRVLNHLDSQVSKTTSSYRTRTSSTTNGAVVGLSSFDSEHIQIAFIGDN